MTPIFVQRHSGEQAFERLYRTHVQDVYRYALMVLRNRDDAEDVAQTTFLKAYRAYQRGERPRHPRQWLITIAHNTCGTRIRDARRRPREVALEEQLFEPTPAGGEEVDVQELVRAVGALSFNQRSALVMRELEGRTYAEIAAVLEVSTSAVETLLFRARRALREQLEGTLTCGEAERVLSLELDGRLPKDERPKLRAHLRECAECAEDGRGSCPGCGSGSVIPIFYGSGTPMMQQLESLNALELAGTPFRPGQPTSRCRDCDHAWPR